jgi:pSer/pThr/pTyr-binding forkhead associated (FHA) protein
MVAALGGLLFGFDTVVISGTAEAPRAVISLDESTLEFIVAIALIGTIFGSILAGRPADAWGRKNAPIALAILYLVTSLGGALAWDWASFLVSRFLGGVAVGRTSVGSPLYIAAISPARYRGRLVAVQQFNVVLGIRLAFLSNDAVARLRPGPAEWRWMLGVLAAPSALFLLLLLPTPESSRWLVARGRIEEVRVVLARLGVDRGGVDQEVAEIRAVRADRDRLSPACPLHEATPRRDSPRWGFRAHLSRPGAHPGARESGERPARRGQPPLDRASEDIMKTTYRAPTLAVRLVLSAGSKAERTIPVLGRSFLIGRDPSCQLRPRDGRVSRRHAEILVEDEAASLHDLGSTNGTFLNGDAVTAIVPLRDDDCIRIGPYAVTVAIGEAEESPDRPGSDDESPAWSIAPGSTAEPSPDPAGSVTHLSPSEEDPRRHSEPAPSVAVPELTTRDADDLLREMSLGWPSAEA